MFSHEKLRDMDRYLIIWMTVDGLLNLNFQWVAITWPEIQHKLLRKKLQARKLKTFYSTEKIMFVINNNVNKIKCDRCMKIMFDSFFLYLSTFEFLFEPFPTVFWLIIHITFNSSFKFFKFLPNNQFLWYNFKTHIQPNYKVMWLLLSLLELLRPKYLSCIIYCS